MGIKEEYNVKWLGHTIQWICITDCMSHTNRINKLGNTILIVLPIVLSSLLIVLLVHS